MKTSSFRIFPIVILVVTIAGVLGLSWMSYAAASARNAQLAAAQQLEGERAQLGERIAQLEKQRVITKIEYEERKIQVPTVAWSGHQTWGIHTRAPEFHMKTQTVRVPKEVHTEDPEIAKEIASARAAVISKERAVVTAQKEEPLWSKLFGIRREIAAFIFSLVILVASLYVIISKKFQQSAQKWAFGSVGTILGYWLG
jgi:hypothetical protein